MASGEDSRSRVIALSGRGREPASENREAHVRLRGIKKVFPAAHGRGPVHALGPLDLDIRRGEFFAVVGPSGCGKSTLFEIIAGLAAPSEGTASFEGAPVTSDVPEGIGVVFQEDASFPWLTVRANIEFGLLGLKLPAAERKRRLEHVLALTGLNDFAGAYPAQLSGGMRQRVCIARTLVKQPRLILLDEPFGALDQNLRETMQVELRKLQQSVGITSLIVTHDQKEAIVLSDLIAVMNDGRIEQIGPPIEIYDRPRTRFVAAFTGVENLLPARVRARAGAKVDVAVGNAIIAGIPALPVAAVSDEMILAVRAEAIAIEAGAPASDRDLSGTVTFARVLGAFMRYEVALAGGLAVTISAHRREGEAIEPGAAVTLRVGASHCALVAG